MDNTQLLHDDGNIQDGHEQYREIDPEFLIRSTNSGSAGPVSSTEENSVGITWYKATFLIVNAALGAGILNFPYAFDETGGVFAGNLAHVIFFSFAMGSLIILSFCAKEKDSKTYQEVVTECCGPRWGYICSVCITLYCFVTCITFIIIIGDQFDRAFASYVGPQFCYHWYLNRKFTMVVSSLLLIIPSCLRRIDGMEIMSYIGVASVMYLMVVVIVELFIGDYPQGEVDIWDINFFKFFNVVPTISFGYQCHVSSVPILSCLRKREASTILKACFSAMIVCFLVYTVSANCGYITFGSLVSSDVLLDYDARQVYVLLAVLLLGLKSWTTYPILLFCVREAVADIYIGIRNLDFLEAARTEAKRRKVIASLLWGATIVLAVFIPGLNTVIRLLGSLAAAFILIFPGMCYMSMTLNREETGEVGGSSHNLKSRIQWVLSLTVGGAYVALGTFTFGLAFTLGVESILHAEAEHPICVPPPPLPPPSFAGMF